MGMQQQGMAKGPPAGRPWQVMTSAGAFSEQVGPFYACDEGLGPQEHGRFGFRVEPRHCNLRPMCHGGMLATFLDVALARGLRLAGGMAPPLPTISLALDYLAPAPLGAWVEARVSVSRIGRSTGFVSAMIYADDAPVLRGSGVFRHFLARQGVEGAGQ